MASLNKDGAGWRIQWQDGAAKRHTLRIGKMTKPDAETMLGRVSRLVIAASIGENPAPDLVTWLRGLSDTMHSRLAARGLVASREATREWTLGELTKAYFGAINVKESTRTAYKQVEAALIGHFGANCKLSTIGPMQAEQWARAMKDSGYAQATCSKQVKVARGLFRRGVRWGMIASSPFADIRAGSQSNSDRSVFVPRDVIAKVLAACPDCEWRSIVGLSRFAGLRCPSETLALRWVDVDWHARRLRVRSPKTEHHEGGAMRFVPIAPELMLILEEAFEQAETGSEYVVTRYRSATANLRSRLEDIIADAGVVQWPRLYHNLRASVQTEWAATFPLADVCKWIGNTVAVASKHYLQSNDANFDAATRHTTGDLKTSGAKSDVKATQNATTHGRVPTGTRGKEIAQPVVASTVVQNEKSPYTFVQGASMGATGLEPVTSAM